MKYLRTRPAAAHRRGGRAGPWLLGALVLLLGGLAAALLLVEEDFLIAQFEQRVGAALDRDIRLDGLAWRLLPHPSLSLRGLRIAGTPEADRDLATVERVDLVPDLGAALRGRAVLAHATLARPRLHLGPALEAAGPGAPTWDPDTLRRAGRHLRVLHATDGRLRYRDADGRLVVDLGVPELVIDRKAEAWNLDLRGELDGLRLPAGWYSIDRSRPFGNLSGDVRVRTADEPGAPLARRLRLDGDLRFLGPAEASDLDIALGPQPAGDGPRGLLATLDGRWRGLSLEGRFSGGDLAALFEEDRPYAVEAALAFGDSRIEAGGSVTRPLALSGVDLGVRLSGPNPQRLYLLFGLPLPSLPPYDLQGRLTLDERRWRLERISGRVGDSDLSGELALDLSASLPEVQGELHSRVLDLDDLGLVIGLPPATGPDETASAVQRRLAEGASEDPDVLPERRFALERLGGLAARIHYRADRVAAGGLPLDDLEVDFALEEARLTLDPLDFGIGEGRVRNHLTIDAGAPPVRAVLESELRAVDLHRVVRGLSLAEESRGVVGGQGKLWMSGLTTAELLASADGGFTLLMTGGKLDAALVERAGLDLGETVLAEIFERPAVPIDCAYADLQFREGRMRLARGVLDTTDTLFQFDGAVDFGTETIDLTIRPYPKDLSTPTWRSPLRLTGRFGAPQLELDRGRLAARTAAAAGLTVLAGPIGALVPLLETGAGGESIYCEGLATRLEQAQQRGEAP